MNSYRNNNRKNRFKSNGERIYRKRSSNGHKNHNEFNSNSDFRHKNPGRYNQNASKLVEKYNNLAREALSTGDKILSENYLQHADHFSRILSLQETNKNLEEKNNVITMFKNAVEEEKGWAEYLFSGGSMIGLNDKLLNQYVEWIANKRMKALGLDPIYDQPLRNNPLPWTQHWISSKGLQVAPQETEVESYVVGGIKQDIKKNQFSGFKL